ncbi:tetratricopeptide repeat protein [bacterium]|nr:tetratricopeptide repeat protein [bacterium]
MSIKLRDLCFSVGVTALALIPAAIAATVYEAMDYYKKKDYIHANKLFQKASAENPNDWKAHYYQGNCLLALGRYSSAAYHYEIAAKMTHNPHDAHLCQMGAYKAENTGLKSRVAMSNMRNVAQEAQYNRELETSKRKDQILKQADKHASAIKAHAEATINAERANSQMRWRDQNGNMQLDITSDRINQINGEAMTQIQHIKDQAQNNVNNIK